MQALFPIIEGRALLVESLENEETWSLVPMEGDRLVMSSRFPWVSVSDRIVWTPRRIVGMAKCFDLGVRCPFPKGQTPANSTLGRRIRKGVVRVVKPYLPELHPALVSIRSLVSLKKCMAPLMDAVTDTGAAGIRQLVHALYGTHPLLMDRSTDDVPPTVHIAFTRKRAAQITPRAERARTELDSLRTQLAATAKELVEAEMERARLQKITDAFDQAPATTHVLLASHRQDVDTQLQAAQTKVHILRTQHEAQCLQCEELESELDEWKRQRPVVDEIPHPPTPNTTATTTTIDEALRIMLNCLVVSDPREKAISVFKSDDPNVVRNEFRRLSLLFHPDKTHTLPAQTKAYTDQVFRIVLSAKKCLCS